MSILILSGTNEGKPVAVLCDTKVGVAFGPVFNGRTEAEDFVSFSRLKAFQTPSEMDWHPNRENWSEGSYILRMWREAGKVAERPATKFDQDYLTPPSERGDEWTYMSTMTREYFPLFLGCSDHNEISDMLRRQKVLLKGDRTDNTRDCLRVYFRTKAQATAFLRRINAWVARNWHKAYPKPKKTRRAKR